MASLMALLDHCLMEITKAPVVVLLVVVTALVIMAWIVVDWVWFTPKKFERLMREQGLCGTPYRLYYGDLKDSSRMQSEAKNSKPMQGFSNNYLPRVRPFLSQTVNNYGKNCFFWDGPVPVINIGEPELMREVFNRHNDFVKQMANPIINMITPGLLKYEGDKWVYRRKLINPAFNMEKLKLLLPLFHTICAEMINKWEEVLPNLDSEQEIDIQPYMSRLSADAISRAAFGSTFEQGKQIFRLLQDQIALHVRALHTVYIPGLRFLPTKNLRLLRRTDGQIRAVIKGIIDERKKKIERKEESQNDLLNLLMMASTPTTTTTTPPPPPLQDNKLQKFTYYRMTLKELLDECKLFYNAGQETTQTLLTWTLILLSKHPEWQARAREEVLAVFGYKEPPQFEGLSHLKNMNMIFLETLRLYTPALELRRSAVKDTKLGKFSLPKGVVINLPLGFTHHSNEYWGDDVLEFKPERFSQGVSKASILSGANENISSPFFPFGGGPRICIGINFTMIEAKVAISMILQRFEFKLSPAYSHAPMSHGLLRPQFGAHIIFRRLRVGY